MKIPVSVLALVFAAMTSCGEVQIVDDHTFEDISAIAARGGKPFCVVLVDRMQYLSQKYVSTMQRNHGNKMRGAIFNVVDVETPPGESFLQWLCPETLPLTCVFSPRGELVDIIPGDNDESFRQIAESIGRMETGHGRWSNRFGMDKARIIPLLGELFAHRQLLSKGIFIEREVAALADSVKYPYSVALEMEGFVMNGDTLSAKRAAKELLDMKTPYNLNLYRAEFIMAGGVADSAFDIGDEAAIRANCTVMNLGELGMEKTVPIDITLYNDGRKSLTVSSVTTSCSCLRLLGDNGAFAVLPGDSVRLSFALAPQTEGATRGEITVASDAINNPFLKVEVFADFKQ